MTILPQLERDLFNAAEKRLRPDATAPHRRSSSPSSFRTRLGRAAGTVPVIVSVAVAIAIAVGALALVGHGRHAQLSTAATSPGAGSPRAELVQKLGVLRRPQTKGDLEGLQRLDRLLSTSWQLRMSFREWDYRQVDRRLVRVVNVPAWSAKVMIAPIRFPPSPTSGQRREGVQLVLWWTGATFLSQTSLTPSGPQPTSVGAALAHGLSAGPVPPGLVGNVVHGPDVQDGVLLVPDGVASVKLGPFTPNDTPAGLSTKPLNAALATIHGTATVHDNIAAFQLAIPVYTGRPSRWLGPGPAPRFYYPGIPATAQATWFDARGHVIRRTTTQIGATMRVQVARPANHESTREAKLMTRQEAIAEAKRRQASDPDASWIATSGDGEWTVVRIVKPELRPPPPGEKPIGAFEGEQSQLALGHMGRDPARWGVSGRLETSYEPSPGSLARPR